MRHADALAGELSLVSKSDLSHRRGHAITRLVCEFERQAPTLDDEAIELYDVALRFLVADLEQTSLAALSERLADIPNAPPGIIRILAFNDDVTIAGPVLARSPRLEPGDLIAIVGEKGQEHILIVARRADLTEAVTDQVIARGSANVLQTLAANGRAALSNHGRSILITRANADHRLAAALADRFGLPDRLRDRLLDDAAAVLHAHLTSTSPGAPPSAVDEAVAAGVANVAGWIVVPPPAPQPSPPVPAQSEPGDLSHEAPFLDLLRRRDLRGALDILAKRSGLPPEAIRDAFASDDFDLMLAVLRAADMSWAATEETLVSRASGLDRSAFREMMRDKFEMMSLRDAARRINKRRPMTPAA